VRVAWVGAAWAGALRACWGGGVQLGVRRGACAGRARILHASRRSQARPGAGDGPSPAAPPAPHHAIPPAPTHIRIILAPCHQHWKLPGSCTSTRPRCCKNADAPVDRRTGDGNTCFIQFKGFSAVPDPDPTHWWFGGRGLPGTQGEVGTWTSFVSRLCRYVRLASLGFDRGGRSEFTIYQPGAPGVSCCPCAFIHAYAECTRERACKPSTADTGVMVGCRPLSWSEPRCRRTPLRSCSLGGRPSTAFDLPANAGTRCACMACARERADSACRPSRGCVDSGRCGKGRALKIVWGKEAGCLADASRGDSAAGAEGTHAGTRRPAQGQAIAAASAPCPSLQPPMLIPVPGFATPHTGGGLCGEALRRAGGNTLRGAGCAGG
jgi:hypothetical protein